MTFLTVYIQISKFVKDRIQRVLQVAIFLNTFSRMFIESWKSFCKRK